MEPPIILSICIPTYNRAAILEKTLQNIINQNCFDNRTEIIISDNCSTDCTKEISLNYSEKFHNIKYFCNIENLGFDKNIKRSFDLANGEFIKPISDYTIFNENTLDHILKTVEENIKNKPAIFFLNDLTKAKYKIVKCNNLNEFILNASLWACWVSSMGIWKIDYETINNKTKYLGLEFFHYQLLLENVNSKDEIIIDNNSLFVNQQVLNKGGYNFFKIFTTNYLSILNHYTEKNAITKKTYNKEKKLLFQNHLFHYYISLKIKKNFAFDTHNALSHILNNYTFIEVIIYSTEELVHTLITKFLKNTNDFFNKLERN